MECGVKFNFLLIPADHDRPISKGGRNDAADVTHKLQKMGWTPELILSRSDFI